MFGFITDLFINHFYEQCLNICKHLYHSSLCKYNAIRELLHLDTHLVRKISLLLLRKNTLQCFGGGACFYIHFCHICLQIRGKRLFRGFVIGIKCAKEDGVASFLPTALMGFIHEDGTQTWKLPHFLGVVVAAFDLVPEISYSGH